MDIIPLGKRFLIKRTKEQQVNGIILPESADRQEYAIIMAVGQDFSEPYKNVTVGMNVIYNKHAGQKITSDKEEYLMIREEDILAIIK